MAQQIDLVAKSESRVKVSIPEHRRARRRQQPGALRMEGSMPLAHQPTYQASRDDRSNPEMRRAN